MLTFALPILVRNWFRYRYAHHYKQLHRANDTEPMTKSEQKITKKVGQATDKSEQKAVGHATSPEQTNEPAVETAPERTKNTSDLRKEINGPKGLEPTRYGDWESKGRCCDF